MTLAKRAASCAAAPRRMARLAATEPGALLLGSAFLDLPYYDRLLRQLGRQLAGRGYLHAEWGALLHAQGTGRFAAALLQGVCRLHCDRAPRAAIDEALAFLLGHLCHYAADLTCHPAINEAVARSRRDDRRPAELLHTRIERAQSWFFHREVVGQEVFGAPYARQLLAETRGLGVLAPALSPSLWATLCRSCLETYARAPARREVQRWLAGAARYLAALASPLGRLARPRGRDAERLELRRRAYRGPTVDLETPLSAALARTAAAWQAVQDAVDAGALAGLSDRDRRAFLAAVPDVDLHTGQCAR